MLQKLSCLRWCPAKNLTAALITAVVTYIICIIIQSHLTNNLQKDPDPAPVPKPAVKRFLFNLMEEARQKAPSNDECNVDYINKHRLPQDHPCVLDIIRRDFLQQPPPAHVALNLPSREEVDGDVPMSLSLMLLLKNLTNGFYVETFATDGEQYSHTLAVERDQNWSGMLIEPQEEEASSSFKRRAYTLPVCISPEKYPMRMKVSSRHFFGGIISGIRGFLGDQKVMVQCFPIYSILLAAGRTRIDFLSLNTEGYEFKALRTIPFHKVNIRVMLVEFTGQLDKFELLVPFMLKSGYVNYRKLVTDSNAYLFVQDVLRDLRYDPAQDEESAIFV